MSGAGRNGIHLNSTECGEDGMCDVGGEPAVNTVSVEKDSVIHCTFWEKVQGTWKSEKTWKAVSVEGTNVIKLKMYFNFFTM
jgi:hypothetical protein